jgi:uncharacterized OB-fold protein
MEKEYLSANYTVSLPVRLDTGPTLGKFFLELRDHKKIWANKCPKCGRLATPCRSYCGRCLGQEMGEWAEQGDEGVLVSLEVCFYDFIHSSTGQIRKAPWATGLVLLDGGAYMEHLIDPPDPAKNKLGGRYKAVWSDERKGEFHDILYFKMIE